MPRLTIILSSYNRPAGLRAAIASVLAQTFTDWQLVICDDASTDPEVQRVLDSASIDSRVRVLHGPARSAAEKAGLCTFGVLINCALYTSHGDFVSYLADGTTYVPGRCERLVRVLDERRDIDLVYGIQDHVWMNAAGNVVQTREARSPGTLDVWPDGDAYRRLERSNCIDHCGVMERRSTCGGTAWSEDPEHWSHLDWQRWQRLARAGKRFAQLAVVGEVKRTWPTNIGVMLAEGRSIVDVVRARGGQ